MKEKMKDSGIPWIGQIPEDWEVCKIKFLCSEIFSGGTPSTNNDKYWNGDIPWLQSGKIQNDYIFEYDKTITKEGLENSSTKMVMKDSILLAMTGATCSNVGYLTFNSCANQSVMAYIPLKNTNPKFLFYILIACKNEILLHKNGGAQSGINGEVCQNLYAPKLPLKIQQKIVEILDKKCGQIDELVRIEENEIEKLKEYKTSLITKVATKGLDSNAKMKDSGIPWIGQIPYDWEVKRLKYIADIFLKGNGITKDDVVGEGNTPCVRYGDIYTTYEFKFNECKTRTNKEKFSNLQYFTHGDILFTTTGELVEEIGKSVVYMGNKECLAGGDVVIMKHSQAPVFLGYALESSYVREQKSFGKLKLKVVHVSIQDISNLYVALPTKNEQVIIGKYLDEKCEEIDNLIKIKQEKIEKLKEYKKSLIYQYVTGKKEVV